MATGAPKTAKQNIPVTQLPELVLDSRLDTEYENNYTIHIHYESSVAAPREEYWRFQEHIGAGGFGTVWKEECVQGSADMEVRAVKKIRAGKHALSDKASIRELQAMIKFSRQKVNCSFNYSASALQITSLLTQS